MTIHIVTNCIFYGNSAGRKGGAIGIHEGGNPTIVNCTFSGNFATEHGGALQCGQTSETILLNSILWENAAADGPEIAITDWNGKNQATLSISYCNVRGDLEGVYTAPTSIINWGPLNIDVDPCFRQAGIQ